MVQLEKEKAELEKEKAEVEKKKYLMNTLEFYQ